MVPPCSLALCCAPQRLEPQSQTLLRATGHPEHSRHALDSPGPDRVLAQLPLPFWGGGGERQDWGGGACWGDALSRLAPSPIEVRVLGEQALARPQALGG